MDALQWMGAVRMRAQTADKNITIIRSTPVHQLMTLMKLMKMILTKIQVHNNNSSNEKVFWSESGEKSAQIKQRLQAKTVQNML